LTERLHERFGNHPNIGDIRGRGLFQAIELVADRATKEAFDPGLKIHHRIKSLAMANGLICYPSGGTVDGQRGDHVLLAPPFIISPEQLDELADKLDLSVHSALKEAGV